MNKPQIWAIAMLIVHKTSQMTAYLFVMTHLIFLNPSWTRFLQTSLNSKYQVCDIKVFVIYYFIQIWDMR